MSYLSVEEEHIKAIFKQAVVEVMQEQHERFYDLIAEVIEDQGLAKAIREGEATDAVSRDEVYCHLEGTA